MTQLQSYESFVREHGLRVTLGEISKTPFIVEYRKNHSLMRDKGWKVEVKINRAAPGQNTYTFQPPQQ